MNQNNNQNNGYENPYNPWQNNDYNYNDNYNYNNNETMEDKKYKKEKRKILSFVKFLRKSGLKILGVNILLSLIYERTQTYSIYIGMQNSLYFDNGQGLRYGKMFAIAYIIFTILYYAFKYFKGKRNFILLSGMITTCILFGTIPFGYYVKYTDTNVTINKFYKKTTINYKDLEKTKIELNNFEYSKSKEMTTNPRYMLVFGKVGTTYLDLEVYDYKKFLNIENQLSNTKIQYTLLSFTDNSDIKEDIVSKEEFHNEISKYTIDESIDYNWLKGSEDFNSDFYGGSYTKWGNFDKWVLKNIIDKYFVKK